MSIALAIAKSTTSLVAAQTTYKENVIAVNTLITSVLSSSLPVLQNNPPDWPSFVTAYEQANSDALNWVNNVMGRLISVPQEVQGYDTIIRALLADAKTQATALVQNPNDQNAALILTKDLNGLSAQLGLVVAFITGAVTNIQKFKDVLPTMAAQLDLIAKKSAADAKADQAQIDTLLADIASLQQEIKSLTAAIVGLAIADGIALTLGIIATIALWPVGALTWLVLGPAVIAATTAIAIDGVKITADKHKIESDQAQMASLTADVAVLQVLSKNFAAMATEAAAIETNLQAILAEWVQLETEVNTAITDIKAAMANQVKPDYNAVLADIILAATAWKDAYDQAGDLALDLQVNNATLKIGMDSKQVQAALANGTTTNILAYYNSL